VKETLRCRFYVRYVDDFVLLDDSPVRLGALLPSLQNYLDRFRLKLFTEKCNIRPCRCGQHFLGQMIFPTHRLLASKNVRRFTKRMRRMQQHYAQGKITIPEIRQSLMSWLGHARQANTQALREGLMPKLVAFSRQIRPPAIEIAGS